MAFKKTSFINIVKLLLTSLKQDGIDVSEAYLFGSVITGSEDEDSDIDVALVSKDFQGVPYYDMSKISWHRRKIDLRLEIHPFSLDEILKDPPYFYQKIKKHGMRIGQIKLPDAIIAATALCNNLKLATHNITDFAQIDLELYDPFLVP